MSTGLQYKYLILFQQGLHIIMFTKIISYLAPLCSIIVSKLQSTHFHVHTPDLLMTNVCTSSKNPSQVLLSLTSIFCPSMSFTPDPHWNWPSWRLLSPHSPLFHSPSPSSLHFTSYLLCPLDQPQPGPGTHVHFPQSSWMCSEAAEGCPAATPSTDRKRVHLRSGKSCYVPQ